MSSELGADNLFRVNHEFQVLICRPCKHAVRRDQVFAHLISTQHRQPRSWAQYIQSIVQQWDDIEDPPQVDQWPMVIDSPIPSIRVYDDGFLCTQCEGYTCRQLKGLKGHWRDKHQFTLARHAARPTPAQQQDSDNIIAQNSRRVRCQRLFHHGPGSHYIAVGHEAPPGAPSADSIERLIQETRAYQQEGRKASETVIQAGDLDEATPWLNRTGWVQYLQGIQREVLYNSTQRPDDDAEGAEGTALVIWQAMARLARMWPNRVDIYCGSISRGR